MQFLPKSETPLLESPSHYPLSCQILTYVQDATPHSLCEDIILIYYRCKTLFAAMFLIDSKNPTRHINYLSKWPTHRMWLKTSTTKMLTWNWTQQLKTRSWRGFRWWQKPWQWPGDKAWGYVCSCGFGDGFGTTMRRCSSRRHLKFWRGRIILGHWQSPPPPTQFQSLYYRRWVWS